MFYIKTNIAIKPKELICPVFPLGLLKGLLEYWSDQKMGCKYK